MAVKSSAEQKYCNKRFRKKNINFFCNRGMAQNSIQNLTGSEYFFMEFYVRQT